MAPLIALLGVSLIARVAGWLGFDYTNGWASAVAVGLAAMFVLTGAAHFVQPLRGGLIAIVPPALPAPGLLVTVTGVLELIGAIGLLIPATRVAAAVCLGLMLIALFPANVYAAGAKRSEHAPSTPLVPRTLMQALFLAGATLVAVGSI